jgi:hypothetical protein
MGNRAALFRGVRIAVAVLSVAAILSLVVLWVRSYERAERLHGWLSERQAFMIASKQGEVAALTFKPNFHPGFWKWEVRWFPLDSSLSFPSGDMRQYDSVLGFGMIREPIYTLTQLMGPARIDPGSTIRFVEQEDLQRRHSYANFVVLRGTALVVPFWSLVLLTTAIAGIAQIKRRPRFSLRGLLIAVTVVAIALALGASFRL